MAIHPLDLVPVFYGSRALPCPYLPGRLETKALTALGGADADRLHGDLVRAGFRRSHHTSYRPACPGCDACVPVRVVARSFRPRRGFRRAARAVQRLAWRELPAAATEEQYGLFRRYQEARHGGDMGGMSFADYRSMVEETPVDTRIVEARDGARLVAVSLTDRTGDGLSGVYKFWDPALRRDGLGTAIVLWHVGRAVALGLPYVYLGYWVGASPKMDYKRRFAPLEALTPAGWRPFPEPPPGG